MIKKVSCEEARREKNAIAVDSLIFTVTTEKKVTYGYKKILVQT